MDSPTYVLDASVFITAYRGYYSFDLAPGFWGNLVDAAQDGRVLSIRGFGEFKGVKEELESEGDALADWAKTEFSEWFASVDEDDVIASYSVIMAWVNGHTRFTDAAKAKFAGGADGWIAAYSRVRGGIVVTQEASRPGSKASVKLPDVCGNFSITTVNTFEMMRQLGIKWLH